MNECDKPLGVFDSGLGGLTALRHLKALCPNENIIYFGDTGRVPYGTKSAQIIRRYARQDTRFLKSLGVKAILVACGTVSANAMDELREDFGNAVMGVIEPAVDKASALTKNGGKVLILGTEATIESGTYEQLLHSLRPDVTVLTKACPMFVPMVENGLIDSSDAAVRSIVSGYLEPFASEKPDTVILGCTHYPLLLSAVSKVLPDSSFVDSGMAAAEEIKSYLYANGLSAKREHGDISLYVSDGVRNFSRMASSFMGEPIDGVEKIDIEKY